MKTVQLHLEPWPTGKMEARAAEALLQAVRFRDYTHWRREEGRFLIYSLEIGFGYVLYAFPDPDIKGISARYRVAYREDDMILEMELSDARIYRTGIELGGKDCMIRLFLPPSFDTDGYIRGLLQKRRARRVFARNAARMGMIDFPWTGWTDVADRRGEYWGSDTPARTRRLDPDFMELLDRVTALQRFDGLEEHYDEEGCSEKGPVLLEFTGMDEAGYCTGIRVKAEGGLKGFARFELQGFLTADGDGIVVAGNGFRFTMVMDDTVPGGIDEAYLDAHPVPSWSVDTDLKHPSRSEEETI